MYVNLSCVFGNFMPNNNPHNIDDEVAMKLINDGLATKSNFGAELEAKAELEADAKKGGKR